MADRDSAFGKNQIKDRTVTQLELDITNTPTDGQFLQINMPTGDFTAVDIGSIGDITTMQTNIVLNAFRIAINGSLTQFNMVDGIVDEYEDENSIDNPNSTNESYDSVNDLYSPLSLLTPFTQYKMNDNADNTIVTDDGSGLNNGTASANTSTLTDTGKINEALHLDGTSDFINIDSLQSAISSDTTGSFSVWINTDTLTTSRGIWCFGDTNASTLLYLQLNSSGNLFLTAQDSGVNDWAANFTASLSAGTWFHIVVVQDGVEAKLYIDSVEKTLTFTATLDKTAWFADWAGTDNGRIGARNFNSAGNSQFFDGLIDDFRYYQNTVLSQSDIDDIFNSGSGTESSGGVDNMTLISDSFTAVATPDNARIVLFEEDVDSITLNTDLKVFATRDAGQTFTTDFATDNKLDITSHGFSNTDRIMVTSSSQDLPAGLNSATVYYVVNATTNDFELSLTSGGSTVTLTDNGTGTHTAKQVSEMSLTNDGEYEAGKNILTGSANISGQPSGTSMEYNLITGNNKDLKIHGSSLNWD